MHPDGKPVLRLYHYLKAGWALDNIRRRRLKLSRLTDVNDPYEWACVYSTDPDSQRGLERTREQVTEAHGMLSFSRECTTILMWSHYCESHRGICLGFDVPTELVRAVEYVNHVKVIGKLPTLPRKQKKAIIDRMNWAKYKGWSYEKEVRAKARREEKDPDTGLYFVKFDNNLMLKEVIGGARCTVTRKELEIALGDYAGVATKRAWAHPKRFEMIIDEWPPDAR
jgi:hypothetical protein